MFLFPDLKIMISTYKSKISIYKNIKRFLYIEMSTLFSTCFFSSYININFYQSIYLFIYLYSVRLHYTNSPTHMPHWVIIIDI